MLDEKFWDEYSKVYDLACSFIPYQELLEEICQELEIKKGERILEAGCGSGNLAMKIKERGAEVIGLDNSREFLEIYKKKDKEAKVVLADLKESLPFSDNFFDKIASNNALYAMPKEDQFKTLKEFYRTLKPGGKAVVANPRPKLDSKKIFFNHLKKTIEKKGLFNAIIELGRIDMISLTKMARFNFQIEKQGFFFEEKEQKELLEQAGFKEVKTKLVYVNQTVLVVGTR